MEREEIYNLPTDCFFNHDKIPRIDHSEVVDIPSNNLTTSYSCSGFVSTTSTVFADSKNRILDKITFDRPEPYTSSFSEFPFFLSRAITKNNCC